MIRIRTRTRTQKQISVCDVERQLQRKGSPAAPSEDGDTPSSTTFSGNKFRCLCSDFQVTELACRLGLKMGFNLAANKKVITREEWEKKLNDVKIRKEDMNKLVMNFLVTEGYVEAAEKFRMESGTEPDIDLATITDRMAVKKAVQSGNVEDAIEKVNDLNPEILDTNPQLFFHLQQQRLIELIRNGKVEEALEFAQEELAPRGEENLLIVEENTKNGKLNCYCGKFDVTGFRDLQSFLEELERTVALLAFEDVSNCPVGDLLDISQRLKTASEVNAAILTSQSHEKDIGFVESAIVKFGSIIEVFVAILEPLFRENPKLPSLLKMLQWAQNQLDEKAAYPRINDLSTAILEDSAV
ncbi:hypothetical protein V8G54_031933 [Vigna mungo]|uniref:CTLH domain-containing protein n=1 Tax=Vigna mungo TaxID=3915 RepID=A0AAQ3RIC7_VIGMU